MRIQPVILSGGSGSRLWPLSRETQPKHLIPLFDEQTLFQKVILRLTPEMAQPIVVCGESQRFLIASQLQEIGCQPKCILLEPIGRNTAPAIALSALSAAEDDLLLVLPADHIIQNVEKFHQAVVNATPYALSGSFATFGIKPASPHTGYGYIKRGTLLKDSKTEIYSVEKFVEKPDLSTAQDYLKEGTYYWNSGMFLFRADEYLKALKEFTPKVLSACEQAFKRKKVDSDFTRMDKAEFEQSPDISIDYAIMEKAPNQVVIPLDAGWNDVGSWESLCDVLPKDSNQNVIQGDVIVHDVSDSYLRSEHRLVVALGVKNLVLVETADAVLVADKTAGQSVKMIVNQLKTLGRKESVEYKK